MAGQVRGATGPRVPRQPLPRRHAGRRTRERRSLVVDVGGTWRVGMVRMAAVRARDSGRPRLDHRCTAGVGGHGAERVSAGRRRGLVLRLQGRPQRHRLYGSGVPLPSLSLAGAGAAGCRRHAYPFGWHALPDRVAPRSDRRTNDAHPPVARHLPNGRNRRRRRGDRAGAFRRCDGLPRFLPGCRRGAVRRDHARRRLLRRWQREMALRRSGRRLDVRPTRPLISARARDRRMVRPHASVRLRDRSDPLRRRRRSLHGWHAGHASDLRGAGRV